MNLKRIDAVIKAYRAAGAAPDDLARLDFFRGVWEIQARAAAQAGEAGRYEVPSAERLEEWYWSFTPFFSQAPVAVDARLYARTCAEVAAYLTEGGALDPTEAEALRGTDWEALLAGSDVALAGRDPGAFLDAAAPAGDVRAMVLSLALRPMLEPAQQACSEAVHRRAVQGYVTHEKPLRCPACGCEAAVGYVGPTEANDGNGRSLACTQCGCTWEVERIRCVRCGTRSQTRLHYVSIAGDDAHRLHRCDACGGYLRTFFPGAMSRVAFVPEVEDVMMARLDAVAAGQGDASDARQA